TVDSLLTHTRRWTAQGMGYQGVWTARRGQTKDKQIKYYLKIKKKKIRKWMYSLQSMGFSARGVWVTGYCGCMGYGVLFPANQLGGLKNLWDLRDYGLSQSWVKRESTVLLF
ncbi:hypothetical protein K443DRAFT_105555, partial [Laccaria amethystina LaAM-08-1]